LLTQNLRRLLQSISEEDTEEEAEGAEEAKIGPATKRSRSDGYNKWHRSWAREGDELFVNSDDEDVNNEEVPKQSQKDSGVEEANEEDQDDLPLLRLRADFEARKSRIKELVGELIDLLVR
jgi:hypothetical protein